MISGECFLRKHHAKISQYDRIQVALCPMSSQKIISTRPLPNLFHIKYQMLLLDLATRNLNQSCICQYWATLWAHGRFSRSKLTVISYNLVGKLDNNKALLTAPHWRELLSITHILNDKISMHLNALTCTYSLWIQTRIQIICKSVKIVLDNSRDYISILNYTSVKLF